MIFAGKKHLALDWTLSLEASLCGYIASYSSTNCEVIPFKIAFRKSMSDNVIIMCVTFCYRFITALTNRTQ